MLFVPLNPGGPPRYEQLFGAVRQAILDGRLARGSRLPSTRTWAVALGVSRFTVVNAMERLIAEGYLDTRRGNGTYVAQTLPERRMRPSAVGRSAPLLSRPARTAGLSARGAAVSHIVTTGPRRDDGLPRPFHPRRPPLDLFPIRTWTRLVRQRWNHDAQTLLDYGHAAGYRPLREAIARHAAMTRGVRCTADQVIITSGSQQAFDLLFKLLLDPGDQAWIEEPGYLDVRAALVGAGAALTPVPVDADGMDVDEGIRRAPGARLAVVSPSHQYPTGTTLSAARRTRLLNWARANGAWVIEDDYDSYFRYRGHPMSALQGLDSDAGVPGATSRHVAYVGTFSKTMFPSLRLGYCVVPEALAGAVANARAIADRHSPTVDQAALADFIDHGHYDRHLRRVRVLCQQRHGAMQFHFDRILGGAGELTPAAAGTHVVARFQTTARDRRRSESLAVRTACIALDAGIVVFPISRYCLSAPARDGLVLGYGSFTPEQIAPSLEHLARALDAARR